MRVLLTGANGFLGSELADEIINKNFELIKTSRSGCNDIIPCNLEDGLEVKKLLTRFCPDLIIHTAALVPEKIEDYYNEKAFKINETMVQNLTYNPEIAFVFISSMTVYGNLNTKLCSETDVCAPDTPYAKSKRAGELIVSKNCNRSVSIRIPGLFSEKRQSGLVHNTIKSIITNNKLSFPEKPVIWGAMHVKDAAHSIVKVVKAGQSALDNSALNVGYEDIYSINRFLDDCNDIFGIELESYCNHPDFKFDLNKLFKLNALPKNLSLNNALLELKSIYERKYAGENKC